MLDNTGMDIGYGCSLYRESNMGEYIQSGYKVERKRER